MPEEESEHQIGTPHGDTRKGLWAEICASFACLEKGATSGEAVKWADEILKAFDARFPPPVAAVDKCTWTRVGSVWQAGCGHMQEDTPDARPIAVCIRCNKIIKRVANEEN